MPLELSGSSAECLASSLSRGPFTILWACMARLVPSNDFSLHACIVDEQNGLKRVQDLVGVAGDVMAALGPLRPAFEAPAVPEDGTGHDNKRYGDSSRPCSHAK